MITATNAGTATWSVANFQFTGGGYACAAQPVSLLPGGTNSFGCFIPLTSPPTIAKGTIQGAVSISGGTVNYSQPDDLLGNAHYEVLPQDCTAALSTVHGQGTSWAQGWFSGQAPPSGWQWAGAQPSVTFSGDSCPTGKQSPNPFDFTAATTTNAQDWAYNPAAAQQLAATRLGTALPAGYQWTASSQTACSPTVSGVAGDGTVTLSCSDAGTAVYVWSDGQRSQLASDVAGQTKARALALCNARTGVKSGSCTLTIQGGDGSVLPASASAVTVAVGAP